MANWLYLASERILPFTAGVNRVSVRTLLTVRPVYTPDRGRSKISDFRDDERLHLSNHGMAAPMSGQSDNFGIPAQLSQVSPAGTEQDTDTKQQGTSESPTG